MVGKESFLVALVAFFIAIGFIAAIIVNKDFRYFFDFLIFIFLMIFYYYVFYERIKFPLVFLYGSILLGILHFLGHVIMIDNIRLYDHKYLNFLTYDGLLHFIAGFILFYLFYELLLFVNKKNLITNSNYFILIILLVLGVSAFHEILELWAVIFFNAGEKIGDYMNNALDLFISLAGAIFALIIVKSRLFSRI